MPQSMLQGPGTDYKKHFLKYFERFWESQTSLVIERSLTTPQVLAGGQRAQSRVRRRADTPPSSAPQGELFPTWERWPPGFRSGPGPRKRSDMTERLLCMAQHSLQDRCYDDPLYRCGHGGSAWWFVSSPCHASP